MDMVRHDDPRIQFIPLSDTKQDGVSDNLRDCWLGQQAGSMVLIQQPIVAAKPEFAGFRIRNRKSWRAAIPTRERVMQAERDHLDETGIIKMLQSPGAITG